MYGFTYSIGKSDFIRAANINTKITELILDLEGFRRF